MATFHATLHRDSETGKLRVKAGTAREWDMSANAEYTFELGDDSAVIHVVGLDLTPEAVQALAARLLAGLDE
jgi:hypothetical protein